MTKESRRKWMIFVGVAVVVSWGLAYQFSGFDVSVMEVPQVEQKGAMVKDINLLPTEEQAGVVKKRKPEANNNYDTLISSDRHYYNSKLRIGFTLPVNWTIENVNEDNAWVSIHHNHDNRLYIFIDINSDCDYWTKWLSPVKSGTVICGAVGCNISPWDWVFQIPKLSDTPSSSIFELIGPDWPGCSYLKVRGTINDIAPLNMFMESVVNQKISAEANHVDTIFNTSTTVHH